MKNLVVFFLVVFASATVAFGQTSPAPTAAGTDAWWQRIDAAAPWGKWLLATYKPYRDKLQVALTKLDSDSQTDTAGLSQAEVERRTKQAQSDYRNAIKAIVPPPELKGFHAKALKILDERMKAAPDEKLIEQLIAKTSTEMERLLKKHGVPQNIVDELNVGP